MTVFAFDATTNLPKTGDAANLTAYVNKDDAGINVLADTSATEIDSTNAKGYYLFDLAQAETDADKLHFSGKSSTANIVVIAVPAVVYTLPANFTALGVTAGGKVPATLAAGDVTGNLPADLQTIKTQAVTAAAGVTFPASIGTSTYAGADTAGTTLLLSRLGNPTFGTIVADIAALQPASTAAGSGTATTGTVIGGSNSDTATDNGTRWNIAPTASGLVVDQTFSIGVDRIPTLLTFNGFFASGAGQTVTPWAYNNDTSAYESISETSMAVQNGTSDQNKTWTLSDRHVDGSGDVLIQWRSSATSTGYRFQIDRALVYHAASATAAVTPPSVTEIVAADPLNQAFAELTALPTTVLEWLAFLAMRFGAGTVAKALSAGSGTLDTKTAAGDPLFTQAITDDGSGNQTAGPLGLDS